MKAAKADRVKITPQGLNIGGKIVPLIAGSMHYWRHEPHEWETCLDSVKALGFRLVDTYIPWAVHEVAEGEFDFGQRSPRNDVARFLRLAEERDLFVIARPGPHINAELSYFGLPPRIVWNSECQAKTPERNPVVLPMIPIAFPVPSYASATFHRETRRWFKSMAEVIAPLRYPNGPVVMIQVDNEGALYFRDGPYDQDYHPDAIKLFRGFLRAKYNGVKELREAWQTKDVRFVNAEPPKAFDAKEADDLARHMDWMEFHEHLLAYSLEQMTSAVRAVGLDGIPTSHNFPLGEAATPLNAARMRDSIDLVGLDYYHRTNPREHVAIARRTTELASRCEGRGVPPFGAEVGAGFPPFFAPIEEEESIYTLMCALAYGLRGYNCYMAVDRDRWIGAPIDRHGQRRPFAERFRQLNEALERASFHKLRRRAPVRLVIPRSIRRLARATHAFGPVTPALFNVLGAGYRESCLEANFGFGEAPPLVAEAYLRAFEHALNVRGVPFAYAGGEAVDESTVGADWVIAATCGGIKPDFFARLQRTRELGAVVTIGPDVPERDGSMRLLKTPHDVHGLEIEPLVDMSAAATLVAKRIEELKLPTYPADPSGAFVSVHESEAGEPSVIFLMNPAAEDVHATVALPGVQALVDTMSEARVARSAGAFAVRLAPRSVRMFSVERGNASESRIRTR